jgi:hypothetical protein
MSQRFLENAAKQRGADAVAANISSRAVVSPTAPRRDPMRAMSAVRAMREPGVRTNARGLGAARVRLRAHAPAAHVHLRTGGER